MYRMKAFCPKCNKEVEGYDCGDDYYCPECKSRVELLEDHCDSCNDIFDNDDLNENFLCDACQKEANIKHLEYRESIKADYRGSR